MTRAQTWRQATGDALYGPTGFYRRGVGPSGPAGHFRTSVHASPLFAGALVRLLCRLDAALGHPPTLDVVDVGAGRGELLVAMAERTPASVRARLRLQGVEVADRPGSLPAEVGWSSGPPTRVTGLLVANEWLDNVPLDVVASTPDGPRQLLVDPATGAERPGPPPEADDAAWLADWWPIAEADPGVRAEVGRPRDDAWAAVVGTLANGIALAVDYGHCRTERVAGSYDAGTLAGYRDGRAMDPVPDGSRDITAHVAMDACAAAGAGAAGAGATGTLLLSQRDALHALGVRGTRPPRDLAQQDPPGYLAALAEAGEAGELTDPSGLGGFWWLLQSVGVDLMQVFPAPGADGR